MLESENCGVFVENVNDKDCQQKFTRRCVAYADVTNGSQTGPACSGIIETQRYFISVWFTLLFFLLVDGYSASSIHTLIPQKQKKKAKKKNEQ